MQNAAGDDDIARAPHDRNDVYRAVVSDLVSLVEHVQKSLRLIEQTIARETSPGSPESSANIIVLDDVSPRYMKAGAALHACDSERTKRNQCDCPQLYRELERRKRCDRLPVGRIHKQLFHHLRTRLSGFERRKHDQLPRNRVKWADDLLLPSASLQWVCYKPQFQCQKCTDAVLHACGAERTKRNRCD